LPSSPSSPLSLDSAATLDEEISTATDEDNADSEEITAISEELDPSTDSMDVSEETGKFTEELVPSAGSGTLIVSEELDSSELSLESVSAALADESSPQATRPTPSRALKQKTRT
jgi:hypothetical protein